MVGSVRKVLFLEQNPCPLYLAGCLVKLWNNEASTLSSMRFACVNNLTFDVSNEFILSTENNVNLSNYNSF